MGASPHTIVSSRDTFRLLLKFASQHFHRRASDLQVEDLDAKLVSTFLKHLEHDRHNRARTRNNRLCAIHAFPTAKGTAMSSDTLQRLVARHLKAAAKTCPSLRSKRVSPHHCHPAMAGAGGGACRDNCATTIISFQWFQVVIVGCCSPMCA